MYSSPHLQDAIARRRRDICEMFLLLGAGWQHIGDDLWLPPHDNDIHTRPAALTAQFSPIYSGEHRHDRNA